MKTFLLAWNPSEDTTTDIPNIITQFGAGNKVKMKWSVSNSKKPKPNDRFYLMKVGNSGRGIFASGVITSIPMSEQHYDIAKAKKGKTLNFVDIEFDFLVDLAKSRGITWQELKEINALTQIEQTWTPENSGIEIKSEIVPYIDKAWKLFREERIVITEAEYIDAAKILDKVVESSVRTEQQFLRNKLFNYSKHATCCICNFLMPVKFLVTAHIKKRSTCTETEKRDYKNIVTPMCKFGCDELYERGFIAVHDGQVINLGKLSDGYGHDYIQEYLKKITGQKCNTYNGKSSDYFEWHYDEHK